jgi:hypothetical protein
VYHWRFRGPPPLFPFSLSLAHHTDALLLDSAAAVHAPTGSELSIGIVNMMNGGNSGNNGTTTSARQHLQQHLHPHAATVTTIAVVAPFIGRSPSSSSSVSWNDVTIRPRAVASHHQNMGHQYEVVCDNAAAVMTLQQQEQAFDGSPRLDWEILVSSKQDA